jgi:hypothetical protein
MTLTYGLTADSGRSAPARADEVAQVVSAGGKPRTVRARLLGGVASRTVRVLRICVHLKGIGEKKRRVAAEATKLSTLKRGVVFAESGFKRFLRAHPETSLMPSAYARYKALRTSYASAVAKYNAQVIVYNAAVRRHNDVLHSCSV